MIWIIPLVGLIIFEIIADVFAKEYSLRGNWLLWILAITGYVIANSFWLYSLKNGAGLTRGANIFSVSTAVVATIIGFYIYHKKLNNFQIAGIFVGMLSLVLIFWES